MCTAVYIRWKEFLLFGPYLQLVYFGTLCIYSFARAENGSASRNVSVYNFGGPNKYCVSSSYWFLIWNYNCNKQVEITDISFYLNSPKRVFRFFNLYLFLSLIWILYIDIMQFIFRHYYNTIRLLLSWNFGLKFYFHENNFPFPCTKSHNT